MWGGYLPSHIDLEAPVATPVKLTPAAGVAGFARKAAMPSLKLADEDTLPEPETFRPPQEAAGLARQVSAPRIRVSESEDSSDGESVSPAAAAAGVARGVAQPAFKVAEESPSEEPAPAQAHIVPSAEAAGAARAAATPDLKVAEPSTAESEVAAIFREEASGYLTELSVALGLLRTADSDEQWEIARRLSHTIKGSAAQVGLAEVSEQAKTAEFIARSAEEDKEERGAARVADLIRAVEHVARLLGITFKLVTPEEAPQATAPGAIDRELVGAFILDARDQLDQLEGALLTWERGEAPEPSRAAVYRAYHTLKGAANSIGMNALGANIHAVESLIEGSSSGSMPAKEWFTFLLGTVDQLRKFAAELERDPAAAWTLDWNPTVAVLNAAPVAQPAPAPKPVVVEAPVETDIDAELIRAVALDIRDQASVLETAVIAWERGHEPAEQVGAAYRAFHTLKGSANSVGLRTLGSDFHAVESLLDRATKAGAPAPSPRLVAFLLAAVDQLSRFSETLLRDPKSVWPNDWKAETGTYADEFKVDRAAQTDAAVTAEDDTTPVVADTLRVDITRIHKLMNQVGELVVERNRFTSKLERAIALRQLLGGNRQRLTRIVENFQDQFEYSSTRQRGGGGGGRSIIPFPANAEGGLTDEFSELEFDRYDEFNMLSRQLTEVADDLGQVTVELERLIESFRTDEQRFAANSKVMQEDITGFTSQPIDSLFRRLDRIFRDAVQAEQKEATLRFEGARTTLDRSIIERLYTPLLHLVRNAVAHGIEPGDARTAAGKDRKGNVTVSASQSSNQIVLSIRDDGRGIDPARVLHRAKERGLIAPSVTELSHEQTLHMIFTPGFSTATDVSSVAGRGVGLDVVKSEVEAMNGSVTAEWVLGEGTTWKLLLPLSLAVTEAIIVGLDTDEFAIPLNFTESGILLDPHQVRVRDGAENYAIGAEELPLIRLANVFASGDAAQATRGVIISVGDARAVLAVDSVPARREIVVKGFDPLLARHPLLEGATLDAEGRPVLILNAPALLRLVESGALTALTAHAARAATPTQTRERKAGERFTAMVVDDSLSVRAVQERLLGELGCEVVLATDGLDAIEKLRARRVDIIFTDLEMPRMNGYDLISTVRLNPNWSTLPMVLVTSRAGQKHLDKALNLGCNDFLVKPFTQDDLARVLAAHGGYQIGAIA